MSETDERMLMVRFKAQALPFLEGFAYASKKALSAPERLTVGQACAVVRMDGH